MATAPRLPTLGASRDPPPVQPWALKHWVSHQILTALVGNHHLMDHDGWLVDVHDG